MKPGSIASEAARLSAELGILVTPDKVKWWRKKRYPMNDTPALLKCIRNQERIAGDPAAVKALRQKAYKATETAPDHDDTEYEPEIPSLAELLITDKDIEDAKGFVPMSEVLDYLRDQWEADEWNDPDRFANKPKEEIEKMVRRDVAFRFADLKMLMPSVARPPWPEWLDAILYPDESKSLQAGDDSAPESSALEGKTPSPAS